MDFFDSLKDTIQESAEQSFSNFSNQFVTGSLESLGLITVGEPPKTNLTSKQVSAGELGSNMNSTIIPRPLNTGLKDNMGFPLIGKVSTPIMIVGALVLGALFIRSRR